MKKQFYYLFNIVSVVDCVDKDKSDIVCGVPDEPDYILSMWKTHFIQERIPNLPVFSVPEYHWPFVTRSFVDAVIANKLTGAQFEDPGVNPFGLIMGETAAERGPRRDRVRRQGNGDPGRENRGWDDVIEFQE
ncbi:MAG: hypothetical protein MZV49_09170 [Rhodopseudomonas palustris]|nr:hypothetical protein [Rhodopseudomonas palustris]